MRATDDRYAGERDRFDPAIRMIGHEARTRTIRHCTGLSDDRIRKLYATYFKHQNRTDVRRRRGKSPQQIGLFVKSPEHQFESTTMACLFVVSGLFQPTPERTLGVVDSPIDVRFGHRFCRAYETYLKLHERARLSFEWAWNLLFALDAGEELRIQDCMLCGSIYVRDVLALDQDHCPACTLLRKGPSPAPW